METHELYGLPLDRFVVERGALARALRGQGHREQAATVAALRKPSVAAWAVNQLVRTQSRAVAALFGAGDQLQRAQSDLLAGRGDARALRAAAERERAAVNELAEVARGLLSSEGHELTQATLERVAETLHAAALEEAARAQVRDGCLHRNLRHVGLGTSGELSQPALGASSRGEAKARRKAATRGAATPTPAKSTTTLKREAERHAQAERAEQERAARLKAAREAERDAGRVAQRAGREMKSAQGRRDRAADALHAAEGVLAAARESAEDAALAHRRAQQALEGF